MVPLCFTIDVEDWLQSSVDFDAPITDRCVTNTRRMLDLFSELEVVGTWFVQGLVARKYPELVAEIARRGHEVACHAHTHRPLHRMSLPALRDEIATARKAIEDACGASVYGFRAPDFSVGEPCDRMDEVERGIFAVLAEQGFLYDSSVVPARTRRYGVANAPAGPFWLREGLLEIPLATTWAGRRWPALGGGYLRLFPFAYHQLAIRQAERERRPIVVYLHPYELDTAEVAAVARSRSVSWKFQLSQQLGRGTSLMRRVRRLRGKRTAQTMERSFRELERRRDLPVL